MNELLIESDRFLWYSRVKSRYLTIEEKANIIELYIYQELSIPVICKIHSISYLVCSKVINLYFEKPPFGLCILSKV